MLPILRRVLRCLCTPVRHCGSCFAVCGEVCCEVVKNPAFLVVFIILCIHSTILISYFTFANTAKPKQNAAKPNPLDAIMALPEYSVYLPVAPNGTRPGESVHIGSEDFRYPLLVDMVQLVRRVRSRQPISVAPINRQAFRFPIDQPGLCRRRPVQLNATTTNTGTVARTTTTSTRNKQQPAANGTAANYATNSVQKNSRLSRLSRQRRHLSPTPTLTPSPTPPPPRTPFSRRQPGIVLVIKSALGHFEQRQLIRDTWGNLNCWPSGSSVRRVFMVGRPKSSEPAADFAARLAAEVKQHDDVVQADFVDHYFNNTLKMMASFTWMMENCGQAKFAFFLDDDYVVSPLNLVRFADAIPEESYDRTMAGFVWRNAAPVRKLPKRNPHSRWLISYREYPWPMYPAYVSAGAFLVSMPIIRDFNIAMEYTRYLRFDDVFLGILMHKLRVVPLHAERIHSFNPVYPGSGSFPGMIASHGYASKPDKVRSAWSEILNRTGAEDKLPLECILTM